MSHVTEQTIRHPYVNEVPADLMRGFEAYRIDSEWQWVLIVDGSVKAQMLCANAHGILLILRLIAFPDAPHGWLAAMLRHVMAEARQAGCIGFITFLSDRNPAEVKLMRIVQRMGGFVLPQSGAMVAGSTETKY
jgi:hypothetical protein